MNSSALKLFRKAYGLEQDNPAEEERDINSPSFNPHKYFTESISTDSVPNLIAKENTFLSEIKSYENELQSLVYGNYQKFLNAADTVQKLSENISQLKTQMNDLSSHVQTIARKDDELSRKLGPNRQNVAKLVGISRLLQRVKFIANLPTQLNLCLEQEKYATAVNVWTKVETLLTTHSDFPSFSKIHQESSKIMEEIKTQIRGQMLNTDISVSDSVDSALLLIRLKTPLGLICSQLAHHRFLVIDNTLEYEEIPSDPFKALDSLNKFVISDAKLFIELYKEKLVPLEKDSTTKVDGVLSDFMSNTFERISQFLPLQQLFQLTALQLVEYLSQFDSLVRSIATPEQLSRRTHRTLQQYTESRTMEIFNGVEEFLSNDSAEKDITVDRIVSLLTDPLIALIDEFAALAAKFPECGQYLTQQIQLMIARVLKLFRAANPQFALHLGLAATLIGDRELQHIFENVQRIEPDLPPVIGSLSKDCKRTASLCLKGFVASRRRFYDTALISAVDSIDWQKNGEKPNQPSKFVVDFVASIDGLHSQLVKVLEAKVPRSPYKASIFGVGNPNFSGTRTANDVIASMFSSVNSLHLGREISFETPQIVTAIAMYGVKTILELIRNQTFSSFGFNQVQIDCFFLYSSLKEKIDSVDTFGTLIEEIVVSAAEATIDPVPLDLHELLAIYEHFLNINM